MSDELTSSLADCPSSLLIELPAVCHRIKDSKYLLSLLLPTGYVYSDLIRATRPIYHVRYVDLIYLLFWDIVERIL